MAVGQSLETLVGGPRTIDGHGVLLKCFSMTAEAFRKVCGFFEFAAGCQEAFKT